MNTLHVGLAGYGYWGPNLMRVLQERDDVRVVACCDPDPAQRTRMLARYPGVAAVPTLEELLESDVDAVVLATPIATHAACVQSALQRGKHVFVEKPLCTTVEEAEFLVDLAYRRGLTLAVGHTFLYHPAVLAVRDAIHSGAMGEVHYISSCRANLDVYRHDTNVLWDLAVHDLSILHYWLSGGPANVQVTGRGCQHARHPDVAFLALTFPGGVIAHVEVSWLAPSKLRRMVVVGSRQMAVFDDTESREKLRFHQRSVQPPPPQNFGEFQLCCRQGDILAPWLGAREPLAAEMEDFVLAVRQGGAPRSDGRLGADVVRTLVRLQQCWEDQFVPYAFPPSSVEARIAPYPRTVSGGAKRHGQSAAS